MFKVGAEKRFRMALNSWWEEVRNDIGGKEDKSRVRKKLEEERRPK